MPDFNLVRGGNWSADEVQRTCAAYFQMLQAELHGLPYSKADYRRRLLPLLAGRSEPSVGFKHANISAVLVRMGCPYIDGYKPRGNYQALLAEQVEAFLSQHPGLLVGLGDAPVLNPQEIPQMPGLPVLRLFEPPPDRIQAPDEPSQPWVTRKGRKIDFVKRDPDNHRLGKMGEEFVVKLEQRRLLEQGRDDLAKKVEWVASTRGDGLGFDILSFNDDESERLVEVKTTGLGKFFPFYVTSNEVRCSEACSGQYHLYRVYDFARSPRVYVLRGALSQACRLEPRSYLAVI